MCDVKQGCGAVTKVGARAGEEYRKLGYITRTVRPRDKNHVASIFVDMSGILSKEDGNINLMVQ